MSRPTLRDVRRAVLIAVACAATACAGAATSAPDDPTPSTPAVSTATGGDAAGETAILAEGIPTRVGDVELIASDVGNTSAQISVNVIDDG